MIVLTLLFACSKTDTDTEATCAVTFTTSIADGATDVPGNASVVVALSESAEVTLTGSIPGTTTATADGRTLTWSPNAPADANSALSLTIDSCNGTSTIGWQTSDLGATPTDVDLTRTGFRVDLASGTIVQPISGPALFEFLSGQGTEVLVGLLSNTSPGYRLAVAKDGVQDLCSRTLDVTGGTLDRGWFSFGPADATFYVYDNLVELHDLSFGGGLSADGTRVGAAWVKAWVGVEPLAATYADGDIDAACEYFGSLQVPCVPCPSGDGQCLAIDVRDLSGTATGTPIDAITEACPE
jgi:hypothetical protein